jgi:DNA-directed RNA polymerase subunit RPC12/RpoP
MADAFNEAWGIVKFDWSGRKCKDCGTELSDEDFDEYGSWNYTCPECGTSYKHGDDDPYEQNW